MSLHVSSVFFYRCIYFLGHLAESQEGEREQLIASPPNVFFFFSLVEILLSDIARKSFMENSQYNEHH